jgi:pentatricopeptide repeat protein
MPKVTRLIFLLLLQRSFPSLAFVPTSLEASTRIFGNNALNSVPPTTESAINEVDAQGSFRDSASVSNLTALFLESSQPGALTKEILSDVFPLLLWWGKTESAEGAATVERLLVRLEEEIEAGNELLNLKNKHYTVAVDAWGKSGHEDSARNAEKILERMKVMGRSNPSLAPTRVTYNAVMHAHSKQGDTKRAAEILEFMENSSGIELITNDYNVMLGAHAKLGEARQAEIILKRMIDRCNELGEECECTPDLYSYNMLLSAWAKSDEQGRGKRAEDIFEMLEKRFQNGEFEWKPDARTYLAAISAVVRSDHPNAIKRAEELLAQAESRGIAPDIYLHSALLDAYASSTSSTSAERAEVLLEKLENEGVANDVSYNTVLKAWKTSEDASAPARAEALVKKMEERGLADTISYSTLIAVYANKGGLESAERADEILQGMQGMGATPNTQTLNAGKISA